MNGLDIQSLREPIRVILNEIARYNPPVGATNSDTVPSRPRLVPAVNNAVALVNFLNRSAPRPATLAELSSRLCITKSHCHSILKTLVHAGWVRFDVQTKCYELAPGLITSASSLLNSPALSRVRERLDSLTRQIGFSGLLTQPHPDGPFVVIENFAAARSMEFSYSVGFQFPKDSPAQSRAYIAWQGPDRIKRWLDNLNPSRYTTASLVDRAALEREIALTRNRGYSRSVGEHFDAMMALGMPIFGRNEEVLYVFCVIGIVQDLLAEEHAVASAMRETVWAIHQALVSKLPREFPAPAVQGLQLS